MTDADTFAAEVSRLPWAKDPGEVARIWSRSHVMVRLPPRFAVAHQHQILTELGRVSPLRRDQFPLVIQVTPPETLARTSACQVGSPLGSLASERIDLNTLDVRVWHQRRDGITYEILEGSLASGAAILAWEVEAMRYDWDYGGP